MSLDGATQKADSVPNNDANFFEIEFKLADAKSRDNAGESNVFDNRMKVADTEHVDTGDLSYEIKPDQAMEMVDVSNNGWILRQK